MIQIKGEKNKELTNKLLREKSIGVKLNDQEFFDGYQSPAISAFKRIRKNHGTEIIEGGEKILFYKRRDYHLKCEAEIKELLNTSKNKLISLVSKKMCEQMPLKRLPEDMSITDKIIVIKQKEIRKFFGIKDKKYAKNVTLNAARVLLNSSTLVLLVVMTRDKSLEKKGII
ncbi:hypothetical protein AGMMS49936_11160 [Endomicrobiia bacterium]|nr:hypothetical protein AGMMS49936_11160 [Endomicrobiia bacterium]